MAATRPFRGGDVAAHGGLEGQALALADHGDAVVADGPGDDHHVAGLSVAAGDVQARRDEAHPGRVDKEAVRAAAFHHLGIAGDDLHPGLLGRGRHRSDHPAQGLHLQPFLQDKTGGEVQGRGPHHAQVVHCAADGQAANIAAGEKERLDHVGIGSEGQAPSSKFQVPGSRFSFSVSRFPISWGQLQDGGIVALIQQGVGEGRAKELVNKVVAQLAA